MRGTEATAGGVTKVLRGRRQFTFIRRSGAGKVGAVISSPEPRDPVLRIAELRLASPADATLRNLLSVLTTKLELSSRLPVYAWEASHDGDDEAAAGFRRLAEAEQRSCGQVIDELRRMLQPAGPDDGAGA